MDLIVRRTKDANGRYTAGSIGFYTSGQLFAEEHYTLGMIAKAGIGCAPPTSSPFTDGIR